MLRLMMPALVAVVAGCAAHAPLPVVVKAGAVTDVPCVDRLVTRTRAAGYVETAVDRNTGFLRVQITTLRSGKPIRTGTRGKLYNFYFNTQCAHDGLSATVSGADDRGTFGDERRAPKWFKEELDDFAAQLFNF
jgi:hypothetical protein